MGLPIWGKIQEVKFETLDPDPVSQPPLPS